MPGLAVLCAHAAVLVIAPKVASVQGKGPTPNTVHEPPRMRES